MTEAASRRRRWPKGRVRALAWGTGGAAFIMAAAPLVAAPKPPDVASGHAVKGAAPPRQVIERRITRKVVIVDPVVSTPVYTGGSGYTGSSGGTSSGGGQISANPAPAPAPPTTSTGGS